MGEKFFLSKSFFLQPSAGSSARKLVVFTRDSHVFFAKETMVLPRKVVVSPDPNKQAAPFPPLSVKSFLQV